jgi:hypothetical protein
MTIEVDSPSVCRLPFGRVMVVALRPAWVTFRRYAEPASTGGIELLPLALDRRVTFQRLNQPAHRRWQAAERGLPRAGEISTSFLSRCTVNSEVPPAHGKPVG